MIWFDNIKKLQYYNQIPGLPCYCDELVVASDLMLQGSFAPQNGNYSIVIRVYDPSGVTLYEDATSSFDYYFFTNPVNGRHTFNARLKAFTDEMCTHKCFIIRVTITGNGNTYFDSYTERYCISDCCDYARGITYELDGVITIGSNTSAPSSGVQPVATALNKCGQELIRLISASTCYNSFTDEYYGMPDDTISGTATFSFLKINTFRGKIAQRPRTIEIQRSYNCNVQRVESTPQYQLQSFEYCPAYKMKDIEGQLHSDYIWVDDNIDVIRYQYPGGTPFTQLKNCIEVFKFDVNLQECTQRQNYGCDEPCSINAAYGGFDKLYTIPNNYQGGNFFDDNRQVIANNVAGLVQWFRSQNGVSAAEEIATSPVFCDIDSIIGVSGSGYLPSYIYFDKPIAAKRVYGAEYDTISELCSGEAASCPVPIVGTITVTASPCVDPTVGTITVTDETATDVNIYGHGDWVIDAGESSASYFKNQTTFNIKVTNSTIIPVDSEDAPNFSGEIIGVIDAEGRPSVAQTLDSTNNQSLGDNQAITVDEYGVIRYYGEPTLLNVDESVVIEFDNLIFNT